MDIPAFDDMNQAEDDNKNLDNIEMTDDDLPFQERNLIKMAFKKVRPHKKVCYFKKNNIKHIDFKDVEMLKMFIGAAGKNSPRRATGTCAKH